MPLRKMTAFSHLQRRKAKPFIATQHLFAFAAPSLHLREQTQLAQCLPTTVPAPTGVRLTGLLTRLKANVSRKQPYQAKYAAELERSLGCLKSQTASPALQLGEEELREILDENVRQCQIHVDSLYSALQTAVESNLKAQFLNTSSGDVDSWQIPATFMAPRMSPSAAGATLRHCFWSTLGNPNQKRKAIKLLVSRNGRRCSEDFSAAQARENARINAKVIATARSPLSLTGNAALGVTEPI